MPFISITDEQENSIRSALRAGQYNLLLGAGFSADSKNNFGNLPVGSELGEELRNITGAKSNALQRLYDLLSPDQVRSCIVERLSGCKPGKTAQLMSSFVWRRIFTWNVDDVIENQYRQSKTLQSINAVHFSDGYIEPNSLEQLLLVYLHGYVGEPDKGFVFSKEQYINNITKINPWMTVLTHFLLSEPFIISGASLDETDLDYYLAQRTNDNIRSDRAPSIFVASDDPIARNICKKHDLLLFDGYSAEFFEYLKKLLPQTPTPYELIPAEIDKLFPSDTSKNAIMAFNSDFEIVPGSLPAPTGPRTVSKFMRGHIPTWADLDRSLDVPRSTVAQIVEKAEAYLSSPNIESQFIVLLDSPGTGKTTALRRASFELAKKGIRTFWSISLTGIGVVTADIVNLIDGPLVIVIDNLADQVNAVVDFADRLEKKDVVFICAERAYRTSYLRQALTDLNHSESNLLPLTPSQIRNLVDRYVDAGALGDHTILKSRDQFIANSRKDPIAVICCRILNDFRPLHRIVDSLSLSVEHSVLKRYLGVALAHHCFYGGIRYGILASAFGAGRLTSQFGSDSPLPFEFCEGQKQFVIPENATIAEAILERVAARDPGELMDVFVRLAIELGPWVNRRTIRGRSPEAKLSGRLLDFDAVVSKFLKNDSESFYNRVQDVWKWNSRYWEQIALLNLNKYHINIAIEEAIDFLENAVTYARHAVSIEHHPFPLTTLGKVLFTHMLAPGVNASDSFNEGFVRITEAISIEQRRRRFAAQPYSILFAGIIKYLINGGSISNEQFIKLESIVYSASSTFNRNLELQEQIAELRGLL